MATNLSTVQIFPYYKKITLANTNTHEIIISDKSQTISIGSEASKIYVARNGATDGVAMPADKVWVSAGNLIAFNLQHGTGKAESFFVAPDSAPADILVIME